MAKKRKTCAVCRGYLTKRSRVTTLPADLPPTCGTWAMAAREGNRTCHVDCLERGLAVIKRGY
jgi:hypothetical protein